jgi:hypothetical protein
VIAEFNFLVIQKIRMLTSSMKREIPGFAFSLFEFRGFSIDELNRPSRCGQPHCRARSHHSFMPQQAQMALFECLARATS